MRLAHEILLTAEDRDELVALTRSKLTSVRLTQRAHIVLLAADGLKNKDIAAQVGVGRNLVTRWRERYAQLGLAGIERNRFAHAAQFIECLSLGLAFLSCMSTRGRTNFGILGASVSAHCGHAPKSALKKGGSQRTSTAAKKQKPAFSEGESRVYVHYGTS